MPTSCTENSNKTNLLASQPAFAGRPNPASEKILINFAEPSSISQFELVNIAGQVLQRTQTITFNTEINIAHLQAGMYVLCIKGKNGLSTKSFIKQ